MRILVLVSALFLASCGADNPNNSSTDVSISLGQSIASGAIGAAGSIPDNIQSVSVEALNPAGKVIAGPIIANRPNFTITIRVPNGNGIRFRILAYAQASATGVVLYETLSAPVDLKGKPVAVPVKMNLSVKIAADTNSTFRGGLVNLIGKVSGNTPDASSPLLWAKTGGTLANTDPYGATNTWTAPNTLGTYTIAARIDPAVNPDQDPTVKGSVQITVVNRDPVITLSASTLTVAIGTTNTDIYASTSDPDGDTLTFVLAPSKPSWASIATTGIITLTPPASAAGQTFTIPVGVVDLFGGKASANFTVSVPPTNVDITPPLPPTIDTVTSPTNNNTPFVFGSTEINAVIDIYANGSHVAQTTAIAIDGPTVIGYTQQLNTLADGTYTLTAYATDAAGNRSNASASLSIVIDTLAPAAPAITSPANNVFTNQAAAPTIAGTSEPYASITIEANATNFGTSTADASGAWSFSSATTLSSATYAFTAIATDAAGNASIASPAIIYTVNTAIPTGTTHIWTGTVSTAWNVAGNWNVGTVPTAASNVFIPVAPANQPALAANASVTNVVTEAGATLNLSTFTLAASGNVDATGGITGTTGSLTMSGAAKTLKGNVPNVNVTGTALLAGITTITGNLSLANGNLVGGVLDVNGQALTVTGNLNVTGQGNLKMINALDTVTVNGNATFSGGNSTGLLTAGILNVKGNFTQGGTSNAVAYNRQESFAASGTHTLILNGTTAQTVSFANTIVSKINNFEINNATGVSFINDAVIGGSATILLGNVVSDIPTRAITIGGVLVDTVGNRWKTGQVTLTVSGAVSLPPITSNVTVSGNPILNAGWIITGNLSLANGNLVGGVLDLNGQALTVTGNLNVTGQGNLKMINALDTVTVNGNATVSGGNSTGLLTAGVLNVKGNFTQGGTFNGVAYNRQESFAASGTHKVVLNGTTAQTVSVTSTFSNFNNLDISNVAGVVFASNASINGNLNQLALTTNLSGASTTLTVAGTTTLNNAVVDALYLALGSFSQLDNITFQNYTAGTVISANFAGPSNLTWDGLQFLGTPAFHIGGTGAGNTITFTNTNLDNVTAKVEATFDGTNTIVWPVAAPVGTTHVWTGAVSTNWNVAGNWNVGTVPSATSVVFIPVSATNQPIISADSTIASAITEAGSTLSINSDFNHTTLTLTSDFINNGTISFTSSSTLTANIVLNAGTLENIGNITTSGTGNATHSITAPVNNLGSITLAQNLSINGFNLFDTTNGLVDIATGRKIVINGGTASIGTNTTLTGTGTFEMSGGSLTLVSNYTHTATSAALTFPFSTTINGPGILTNNGNLTFSGEVINTDIANSSTISITGDTSFTGTLSNANAASILIDSSANFVTVTLNSGLTNDGTIDFTSSSTLNADLVLNAGTLENIGSITTSGTGNATHGITAPVNNLGSITLTQNLNISGLFTSPAGISTVGGNGSTLTLNAGVSVDGMTVDNVILAINTIAPTLFDNVTFQNYAATATPLLINYGGATQTFNNLNYNSPLTTGFHIGGTGASNNITVASTNIIGTTAPSLTTSGTLINWPLTVISAVNGNNNPCNVTWTEAGSPYLVQSNVTIASGCRLQIDPYVIVKFNSGLVLNTNTGGILDIYGQAGAPVIFTSIKDDTIGGDSNGDGATTLPASGDWSSVRFNQGSSGSVSFAQVRYSYEGFSIQGASPSLNDINITESFYSALTLSAFNGETTSPTVTNLTIIDQGIEDPVGISILSTVGTGVLNPVFTNISIDNGNSFSPSIEVINLGGGGSLTPIFNGTNSTVTNGNTESILISGIGSNPSLNNFTVTGGTKGLVLDNGATGSYNNMNITGSGSMTSAVSFIGGSSPVSFTNMTLDNATVAYSVIGQGLPADAYTAVTTNMLDPYAVYIEGTFPAGSDWTLGSDPLQTGNSVWRVRNNININGRLQIDPYAIIKIDTGNVTVWARSINVNSGGTLDIYGQASAPVIFTSINDPYAGANVLGATIDSYANQWRSIVYNAGSLGTIQHAQIRNAGWVVVGAHEAPALIIQSDMGNTAPDILDLSIISPNRSGIKISNASPTLQNINIFNALGESTFVSGALLVDANTSNAFPTIDGLNIVNASRGIVVSSTSPHIAQPTITNASISGIPNNREVVYLYGSSGSQLNLNTAFLQGGGRSISIQDGGSAVISDSFLSGAAESAIYLSGNSSTIDFVGLQSSIISTPLSVTLLDGAAFPNVSIPPSIGIMSNTVAFGGNYSTGALTLNNDPLGTGNFQWVLINTLNISGAAVVDIYAGTVIKSKVNSNIVVWNGGTLNFNGTNINPVILTSINDDTVGSPATVSTGAPAPGQSGTITYVNGSSGVVNYLEHRFNAGFTVQSDGINLTGLKLTEGDTLGGLSINTQVAAPITSMIITDLYVETVASPAAAAVAIYGVNAATSPTFAGTATIIKAGTNSTAGAAVTVSGANANVTFNQLNTLGGSIGVLVNSNATALIANSSVIEGSGIGLQAETGGILTVNNSIIRSTIGRAIALYSAGASTISNSFIGNTSGGIYVSGAAPGTVIENNIIRGNNIANSLIEKRSPIYIDSNVLPSSLTIRNNLIVENIALSLTGKEGTIHIAGDGISSGPVVDLYSNTVANNTSTGTGIAVGLVVDAYATVNGFDNIFAFNQDSIATNIDTNIHVLANGSIINYNLSTDGSLPIGGTNITGDPLFTANWYLSDTAAGQGQLSPAINVNPAVAPAWWDPYATVRTDGYVDGSLGDNLDIGYHHNAATVTPTANSTITTDTVTPGLNGTVTIIVTPKDNLGNTLGSGLQVAAAITVGGSTSGTLSLAKDLGDGSYLVIFTASGIAGGSDTVSVAINGIAIGTTTPITW